MKQFDIDPTSSGYFGAFGGQIVPPALKEVLDEIASLYLKVKDTPEFLKELAYYRKHYIGRPSPVYFAEQLSKKIGGADIYLKREDLNHTGAHKINHCIGEVLIAKKLGKKKVIAETGAGQHGVALATAAALLGLPCDIYMGEIDVAKQAPNVARMKILGARIVTVRTGTKSLKDAVDAALIAYLDNPKDIFYAIGSVVGPHPFPMMVRDFQRIVGEEAREQFFEQTGTLPDALVACVGGGSNALGLFSTFLENQEVEIYGVEPSGKGLTPGEHAATLTLGSPANIHGMHTYCLQNDTGSPAPVYSIASGLDYPGVGPQHSFLKDTGRVKYKTASDQECLDAFMALSRLEGIIPALESSHAVAYSMKLAANLGKGKRILVNLSGRGDKDVDYVIEKLGAEGLNSITDQR